MFGNLLISCVCRVDLLDTLGGIERVGVASDRRDVCIDKRLRNDLCIRQKWIMRVLLEDRFELFIDLTISF